MSAEDVSHLLILAMCGTVLGCLISVCIDWVKSWRKPDSSEQSDHNFTEGEE